MQHRHWTPDHRDAVLRRVSAVTVGTAVIGAAGAFGLGFGMVSAAQAADLAKAATQHSTSAAPASTSAKASAKPAATASAKPSAATTTTATKKPTTTKKAWTPAPAAPAPAPAPAQAAVTSGGS